MSYWTPQARHHGIECVPPRYLLIPILFILIYTKYIFITILLIVKTN